VAPKYHYNQVRLYLLSSEETKAANRRQQSIITLRWLKSSPTHIAGNAISVPSSDMSFAVEVIFYCLQEEITWARKFFCNMPLVYNLCIPLLNCIILQSSFPSTSFTTSILQPRLMGACCDGLYWKRSVLLPSTNRDSGVKTLSVFMDVRSECGQSYRTSPVEWISSKHPDSTECIWNQHSRKLVRTWIEYCSSEYPDCSFPHKAGDRAGYFISKRDVLIIQTIRFT
jgi:hypothetical protein